MTEFAQNASNRFLMRRKEELSLTRSDYPVRYCPYCGAPLTPSTIYCEKCGAQIQRPIIKDQAPPYPYSPKATYAIAFLAYSIALLCILMLFLYYMVFLGIPILLIDALLVDPLFLFFVLLTDFVFLIIPIAYIVGLKVKVSKIGLVSGGFKTLVKDTGWGLLVGLALVPIMLALDFYDIVNSPSPIPLGPNDFFLLGIICLGVILVVAPAEEILFRGFMQSSLDAHYGRIAGLLVTSIIFGFFHLNPLIGIFQTIGGILFGLLYQWRNQRLAGPIAAHATYDCIIFLLDAFFL